MFDNVYNDDWNKTLINADAYQMVNIDELIAPYEMKLEYIFFNYSEDFIQL